MGSGGQEILAEGLLAAQQWQVVMQEKVHSHQLIPSGGKLISIFFIPPTPTMKQLPSQFLFSFKSSALVRFFFFF